MFQCFKVSNCEKWLDVLELAGNEFILALNVGCVTLGNLIKLSEPFFPIRRMGIIITASPNCHN